MVILVSVSVITIVLAALAIGKWLKNIADRYERQNEERLERFKNISDNLNTYINGKKDDSSGD